MAFSNASSLSYSKYVVYIILGTIILIMCASNVVVLTTTTTYCHFQMEVIQIIICVLLAAIITAGAFTSKYNTKESKAPCDETTCKEETRDLLIHDKDYPDCFTLDGVHKHNIGTSFRIQRGIRSKTVDVMFPLLTCIPLILCGVLIHDIVMHFFSKTLEDTVCKGRFWFSVAQSAFISAISFFLVLRAILNMHHLCIRME